MNAITGREDRRGMDVKQILVSLLLLVPVWTCKTRCYDEDKLREAAEKKLRTVYRLPTEPQVTGSTAGCPLELYQGLTVEGRSLSPWRYVHVTKEDRFPSTYVEAECLCYGCIMVQDKHRSSPKVVESHDYNSVPIVQTRMFLRREPCNDGQGSRKRYRLTPVYENVVVGCTCARANAASS